MFVSLCSSFHEAGRGSLALGTGSVPAAVGFMEGCVQGLCWRTNPPRGSGNTHGMASAAAGAVHHELTGFFRL